MKMMTFKTWATKKSIAILNYRAHRQEVIKNPLTTFPKKKKSLKQMKKILMPPWSQLE